MERVYLVSLGCPKNRVDSEVMVGKLQEGDWEMVQKPDDADVIVVNTCSFIQPATEESIETVSRWPVQGRGVARSSLSRTHGQRYGTSLEGELPEVDHFLVRETGLMRSWMLGPKRHGPTLTRHVHP